MTHIAKASPEVAVEPTQLTLTLTFAFLLVVIVLAVAAYQFIWRRRVKTENGKSK